MIPYSYNITGNDLSPLNFPIDWNISVKMGLKLPALSGSAYEKLVDRFKKNNISCKVFFTDGDNYIIKKDSSFDTTYTFLYIEIPEQTITTGSLTILDVPHNVPSVNGLEFTGAMYKVTCNNFSFVYTGDFDLNHFYMEQCTIENFSICHREVAQETPTYDSVFNTFGSGEIFIKNSDFTNFHFLSYLLKAGGGSTRFKFTDCTFVNFYYDLVNDTSYPVQQLRTGTHGYGEFPMTFTNCTFTNYYGIYIVSDAQKIVNVSTNPQGMGNVTFSGGTIPATIYPICIESGSSALTKEQCAVYLGRLIYTFEDLTWNNDSFYLLGKISNGYVTYYEDSVYRDVLVTFNKLNFSGDVYLGGYITGNGHVDNGIGYNLTVKTLSTIGGNIYCGNKNETSSVITNGYSTISVYGGSLNNIFGTTVNTISSSVNILLYGGTIKGNVSAKQLPEHSCNRFFVEIATQTVEEQDELIINGTINGTVGESETSILSIAINGNFEYTTTNFSELHLRAYNNVIVSENGSIDVDSLKKVILTTTTATTNNMHTILTFPKTYLTDQRVTYLKNNIVWETKESSTVIPFDGTEGTFLKVEDSADGLSSSIVFYYEISAS